MGAWVLILLPLYVATFVLTIVVMVLCAYALLAYVRSMRPIVMVSLAGDTLRVTNAGKSGIYNARLDTMMPRVQAGESIGESNQRIAIGAGHVGAGRTAEISISGDLRKKIEEGEGRVQVFGMRRANGTPFRMTVAVLADA